MTISPFPLITGLEIKIVQARSVPPNGLKYLIYRKFFTPSSLIEDQKSANNPSNIKEQIQPKKTYWKSFVNWGLFRTLLSNNTSYLEFKDTDEAVAAIMVIIGFEYTLKYRLYWQRWGIQI